MSYPSSGGDLNAQIMEEISTRQLLVLEREIKDGIHADKGNARYFLQNKANPTHG